jgi:hypothetical protein
MSEYNNSVIYKIYCKDDNITDIYIGSTTNFKDRKQMHKHYCNTRDYLVYQFIRQNGGWDNWDMEIIEEYPCDNRKELLKRERYWIEHFNASLNKIIPGRSKAEIDRKYYQENIDKERERRRKYYHQNREKRKEYSKKYHQENRQKRIEYGRKYRQFKKVFKELGQIEIN